MVFAWSNFVMELKNLANTNLVMLSMLLLISKVGAQNSN